MQTEISRRIKVLNPIATTLTHWGSQVETTFAPEVHSSFTIRAHAQPPGSSDTIAGTRAAGKGGFCADETGKRKRPDWPFQNRLRLSMSRLAVEDVARQVRRKSSPPALRTFSDKGALLRWTAKRVCDYESRRDVS